jgi:mono/diheme cytochrome c family protein
MLRWSNIRIGNEQPVSRGNGHLKTDRESFLLWWMVWSALVWCSPTSALGDVLSDFGCAQCHLGVAPAQAYRTHQLSLAEVSTRFSPSYVNGILTQAPEPKARGLQVSHRLALSELERRGLIAALFATAEQRDDGWLNVSSTVRTTGTQVVDDVLGCSGCHAKDGSEPGLATLSRRYRFDHTKTALAKIGLPEAACKHVGQPLTDAQLVAVLNSISPVEGTSQTHQAVTGKANPALIVSAQCGACHTDIVTPNRALDLRKMWGYLKPSWLNAFVRGAQPVRTSGLVPGDGRRHPHFDLSETQVVEVVKALKGLSRAAVGTPDPPPLSASRETAVKRLVSGRYGCTGCHELDGQGGQIGPSLDRVGLRLRSESIRHVLLNPTHYNGQSVMPQWQFSKSHKRLDNLVAFLAHRKDVAVKQSDVPWNRLPLNPPSSQEQLSKGAVLYARHCTQCHGESGKGGGYNAHYLTASPLVHWRQSELSRSTDERLMMGLALGGWVLGKSSEMPGFGGSLTSAELSHLVSHLRTLCACEGPAWSKDVTQ